MLLCLFVLIALPSALILTRNQRQQTYTVTSLNFVLLTIQPPPTWQVRHDKLSGAQGDAITWLCSLPEGEENHQVWIWQISDNHTRSRATINPTSIFFYLLLPAACFFFFSFFLATNKSKFLPTALCMTLHWSNVSNPLRPQFGVSKNEMLANVVHFIKSANITSYPTFQCSSLKHPISPLQPIQFCYLFCFLFIHFALPYNRIL